MELLTPMQTLFEGEGLNAWLRVAGLIGVTGLGDVVQRRVLGRLHAQLEKTGAYWDDAVVQALRRPLSLLVWVVGLSFVADVGLSQTGTALADMRDSLRVIGIVAAFSWFLARLISLVEEGIIALGQEGDEPYDRATLDAIAKLLRIFVFVAASLVALQTLGFSVSGVLAFGGIGGLAVGFAAKDLLANFFGGLTIYLDRPFAVGDWIRSPDREIEGTVERIGWRLTLIRTFDKRPLYIPNAVFTTIAVENPSRMHNRRIYETIGIRYNDAPKMAGIVSDVEHMLRSHPDIDTRALIMVNFVTFARRPWTFSSIPLPGRPTGPPFTRSSRMCCCAFWALSNSTEPRSPFPPRPCIWPMALKPRAPSLILHPFGKTLSSKRRGNPV